MKLYKFWDYSEEEFLGPKLWTEDEVLAFYWDYWCDQMRSVGKRDMICKEYCLEDFCAVHWVEVINA